MFWKKFLLAIWAYVAGTVVATVFNAKKWDKVQEELDITKKEWGDTNKVLLGNVLETHKNLLDWFKKRFLTDENKALLNEKIKEGKVLIKDYAKQAEELIDELQKDPKWKTDEIKQKLESLFEEKKTQVEDKVEEFKEEAPEKADKLKGKLLAHYDEIKKKI